MADFLCPLLTVAGELRFLRLIQVFSHSFAVFIWLYYRYSYDQPYDHAANAPIQPSITCPPLSLIFCAIHDVYSKILDNTQIENLH
jgi:hypothetical protein